MNATLEKIYKLKDPEIRKKNLEAIHYWKKGFYWNISRPVMPDPVFIVGCSRSGTTVTYETLKLSKVFLSFGFELPNFWNSLWGPENNGWHSEAASLENAKPRHRNAAFKFFYERLGAGWILDKTCINVMRISYLYRLFPNAKFVYVYRDGRDNVNSLMEGWRQGPRFALGQFLGSFPCEVKIEDGRFKEWCFFLPPGWRDYNEASLEEVCAYQWITANQMALASAGTIPQEQWIQFRYEDLFSDAVAAFETVFDGLGIPFAPEIRLRCENLTRHPTSIVSGKPKLQKWKTQNPEAIERVLEMIEPMQKRLGYI